MTDEQTKLAQVLEASEFRRAERRRFLRFAGSATIVAGGASLLAACGDDEDTPTPSPTASPSPTPTGTPTPTVSDADVLNFALNLEYLEAQFYSQAAFGKGLDPSLTVGGDGSAAGAVTGGRKVNFTDPVVAQYAREIAYDEIAHVKFLRSALGTAAVAQPALNIDGSTTGAFTTAARAAGVVEMDGVFDPYASDEFFLYGAFIFEDVGVTAYKGGARFLTNKTYLEAAAGILAAEAYHAGLVRTVLYAKGLYDAPQKISDARDILDGATDDDQGIGTSGTANLVPTDDNGLAYSRTVAQVHNIAYLTSAATDRGGFFPNGTNNPNEALTLSGANG